MIEIVVTGQAEPGGSKRGFRNPKTGAIIITDANKKVKGWREQVAAAAYEQYKGPLLTQALELDITFFEPRPKSHYRTGRNEHLLRPAAPTYPAKKPDGLKLRRAVEDSLTGIVWRDDAQVVVGHERKRYGEPARCEIRIRPTDAQTVVDLGLAEEPPPPTPSDDAQIALV